MIQEMIDPVTGEVKLVQQHKDIVHKVDKYVGIETKYPTECLDKKELLLAVRQLDGRIKNKVMIDAMYILDCVSLGLLTPKESLGLQKMFQYLVVWNYGFCTKQDIISQGITTSKNYSRWQTAMLPYFKLEVIHEGLNHYRVIFNPVLIWKGDIRLQLASINNQYKANTKGF